MADRLTKDNPRVAMAKAWVLETTKQSDEELATMLADFRAGYESALSGLSQEQVDFSPGEGEWSISQVGRHLTHAQGVVGGMIATLSRGENPPLEINMGVVPDEPTEAGAIASGLISTFDKLSAASEVLKADPDLETTYSHPWFGAFNARQWFVFCFVHARVHLEQINRVKGSEGYPTA